MARRRDIAGTIYLLHFSQPYKHARHYIGWTENVDARLIEHRSGRASKLTAAAVAIGIDFTIARTWQGTRSDERRRHIAGNGARRCPLCREAKRLEVAA